MVPALPLPPRDLFFGDAFCTQVCPGHVVRCIDEEEEGKGDQVDADHDRDRIQDPANDVGGHRTSPFSDVPTPQTPPAERPEEDGEEGDHRPQDRPVPGLALPFPEFGVDPLVLHRVAADRHGLGVSVPVVVQAKGYRMDIPRSSVRPARRSRASCR